MTIERPPARRLLSPGPAQPCCPCHRDWASLADHLLDGFRQVPPEEVIQYLEDSKRVCRHFGLDDDDCLDMSERLTRHRLLIVTGQIDDKARLDPESHNKRKKSRP